jgi:hypothetical protein
MARPNHNGKLDLHRTKRILQAVMMISAATGEPEEQVLDKVLSGEPPRKGPGSAGVSSKMLTLVKSA